MLGCNSAGGVLLWGGGGTFMQVVSYCGVNIKVYCVLMWVYINVYGVLL